MDILDELKEYREPKLSDTYPDYPCDRCRKDKNTCTSWHDCMGWRMWFGRVWRKMRKNYGKR